MTDREAGVRAVITLLRQRYRVLPVPAFDDEAVEGIEAAYASSPSGVVTADGPEAARALAELKERAEGMAALAREMLESFKQGPNGWSARVKAEQVQEWQERLGEHG